MALKVNSSITRNEINKEMKLYVLNGLLEEVTYILKLHSNTEEHTTQYNTYLPSILFVSKSLKEL